MRAEAFTTRWWAAWLLTTGGNGSGSPDRPRTPLTIETIAAQRKKILRWLDQLGVPERDAPDVAQKVTYGAWTSRATYSPDLAKLDTWLFAIAQRQASNYHQSTWARRSKLIDPVTAPGHYLRVEDTPEDAAARAQQCRRGIALLDRLFPRHAALLLLREYDDERTRDIAAALGVPTGAILRWLESARTALARERRRDAAKAEHWAGVLFWARRKR